MVANHFEGGKPSHARANAATPQRTSGGGMTEATGDRPAFDWSSLMFDRPICMRQPRLRRSTLAFDGAPGQCRDQRIF